MPEAPQANPAAFSESFYTKESLMNLIDALPLAIAVIDKNRHLVLANRRAHQFFNGDMETGLIPPGQALGCINHELSEKGCGFGTACGACRLRQTIEDTLQNGIPCQLREADMVLKASGKRCLRFSTLPLLLGEQNAVLLSMEDVTEAKKHEQTRLEKEKLTAVLQTVGGVCHEINQPLMVILGMAELLAEDLATMDIASGNLAELTRQTRRLGKITRKLMKITRYRTKPYLNGEIIDIEAASSEAPDTPG